MSTTPSRIGSYGTVGLCLALGLRLATFVALPVEIAAAAIVAAATYGRVWAVLLASMLPPPSESSLASRMGQTIPLQRTIGGMLLAMPGLLSFAIMAPSPFLASMAAGTLFLWWIRRFLRQRIGGCTGDCLGFATYMGQLTLLLSITAR